MNEALIYTKAFAKALSDHLRGRKADFIDIRTGSGGCETCGYGASEYGVLDMPALEGAIDQFAKDYAKDYAEEQ